MRETRGRGVTVLTNLCYPVKVREKPEGYEATTGGNVDVKEGKEGPLIYGFRKVISDLNKHSEEL